MQCRLKKVIAVKYLNLVDMRVQIKTRHVLPTWYEFGHTIGHQLAAYTRVSTAHVVISGLLSLVNLS